MKRQDEQKSIEESKNKIRLKQQEAERRRQEELEKKKEKAAELAGFGQMSPRSLERQAATSNPALSSVVSRGNRHLRQLYFNKKGNLRQINLRQRFLRQINLRQSFLR